jgi:hypothetical protein
MPSDDTRRLLKAFGVAMTAYEDAVANNAPLEEIASVEADARGRLQEVMALMDQLRKQASRPSLDEESGE